MNEHTGEREIAFPLCCIIQLRKGKNFLCLSEIAAKSTVATFRLYTHSGKTSEVTSGRYLQLDEEGFGRRKDGERRKHGRKKLSKTNKGNVLERNKLSEIPMKISKAS